jgi:trans-aconitate methyltransferase
VVTGWLPEEYVQGKYFQSVINEMFRARMKIKPFGNVLDIGCGDGEYTYQWAQNLHSGKILGIDNSKEMIRHANLSWVRDNLAFAVQNIEQYQLRTGFDFILSFWCLHWTDISRSFPNIYQALKPGGKLYAIFSSGTGNSVLQILQKWAQKEQCSDLVEQHINSSQPTESYFLQVISILSQLPFQNVKFTIETTKVRLPTLEYFKSLLLALPFVKSCAATISEHLIDDMVEMFQEHCQQHYGGELYYETRPIYLEAIK